VAIEGETLERVALTRGRRHDFCVGDDVEAQPTGNGQAVIEALHPRRNLILRSEATRSKTLAANIDQIAYVLAAEPPFSEGLAVRVLCAAASAHIPLLWFANKADKAESMQVLHRRLAVYRALGLKIFELSALHDSEEVLHRSDWFAALQGRTTLLLGQSGMGKSTLINRLVADAALRTQQWSLALQSGRHTTTFSRSFALDSPAVPGSRIIDSPGFQQFGLSHLSLSEIAYAMPEWRERLGECRFHNCRHLGEPDCVLRAAVERGEVDAQRMRIWEELVAEQQRLLRR
jgi:ribosome biogenesis GTPase